MDLGLTDRVALVTGASMGIGLAVATRLAEEGCHVAMVARRPGPLEEAAADIAAATGRDIIALPGDMTSWDDAERVAAETIEHFGHVDIAVPNAGSSPGGLLEDLTPEQWDGSLNLKFMGHVRTVRAVIGHMRERGSGNITMVVGNDGLKPSHWELAAGVANAADHNFASSIAIQYAPHGIRVNTVNPGPVATTRWDTLEKAFARDKGISQDRAHELTLSSLPLGYICTPEEVADVVVFLASDRASYINGAHVPVDGGQRKALMDR